MKYIIYAILLYVAYQFIFRLLIPVYKTSRRLRKGFREMHDRMQDQMNQSHAGQAPKSANQPDHPGKKVVEPGDYIDFEEVK